MIKDNGNWLSAQQAVQPDGTEIGDLPLVNRKLPPLSHDLSNTTTPYLNRSIEQFCNAIDFAIDKDGLDGLVFLELWRKGAWNEIAKCFPDFDAQLHGE
jgi:hypothetical protein